MHDDSEWQIDNVTEKEDKKISKHFSVEWELIHGQWRKCWNRQIQLEPIDECQLLYE